MKAYLSILTERQRTARLLREQGLSYRKIAAQMDITAPAVRQLLVSAERRFQEFEEYHREQARNDLSIDFPLTRGELGEIVSGLLLLEQERIRQVGGMSVKRDFLSRLPYRSRIVSALLRRARERLDQFDNSVTTPHGNE